MASYNLTFSLAILLLSFSHSPFFLLLLLLVLSSFLAAKVYISALWHLASIVTTLEPLTDLATMSKSHDLLRKRTSMAVCFILAYLFSYEVVSVAFHVLVVRDKFNVFARVVVEGLLVAALVVVNLVGLLLQIVFYYMCKSFHR